MMTADLFLVHFLLYINYTFEGGIHAGWYTSLCLVARWYQIKRADDTGNMDDREGWVKQQTESNLFRCRWDAEVAVNK